MNELDVVRGIGADTPDPDAATTSVARARLLAAIGAEAATGGPADTDMAVDLSARRKARQARRPGRRRRLLPAGAAVAAVLATALAVPLVLHDPAPVTREREAGTGVAGDPLVMAKPAAVKLLTATAAAAARAPDQTLGPGQYWYIREHGISAGTNWDEGGSPKSYHYSYTSERETWWALDGSKITRATASNRKFRTAGDRAKWIADGRPKFNTKPFVYFENPETTDQSDGWLPLTYEQIQQLPTDPARLTEVLSERLYAGLPRASCTVPPTWDRSRPLGPCPQRPVTDGDLFRGILFLLEHYPLPAELRSTLYQMLTQLDGVRLLGDATDVAGRRGVSIIVDDASDGAPDEGMQDRTELIFDPDTGQVLGYRRVLTAPVPGWTLTAGTVMDDIAFETAVADSRPAAPKGDPDA
jgi:hypothetical protein